jgi:hypothetical protein
VEEALRPVVTVAERLRETIHPDGEGTEYRRACGLHAAHRPAFTRAEGEGDEHEREDDEGADDEPTP